LASEIEDRMKSVNEAAGETRWRDSLRFRLPPGVMEKVEGRSTEGLGGIGKFVLRHRLPIGLLLVAISLFMIVGVTKVRINLSFGDFFPTNHRNVELYHKFHNYGGAQGVVLMLKVKDGDIFNLTTLKKIQDITSDVDKLSGVNHQEVKSLASYRLSYAEAVPGGLDAKPFMYPNIPKDQGEIEDLKKHVFANHASVKNFISDDHKAASVTAAFNEDSLDYKELFDGYQAIVKKYTDDNTSIYLMGEPITRGYGYHYLPAIATCFATAILAMIVLLYISLGHRSRWWAPIITGTLSAVWGLGFVGWMGYNFDPVMLVIPFILTARDLSHGIQWQGRYYNELDSCKDKYVAIVATTNYMLPPGFLSIIADIAGIIFVSLGGIPVLHHIGLAGAVWLASSLTMVFVFEPIFLSFSPVPRLKGGAFGEKLWDQYTPSALKNALSALVQIPVTPGKVRGILLLVAGAIMVWGIAAGERAKIGYSTPGTPLYHADSKVNQDIKAIGEYFSSDEGWVILTTPAFPDPQSVLGPDTLRLADDLRDYLLNDPRVKDVVSFSSSIIRGFDQEFHYAHPKFFAVPRNPQQAGNLWYLFLGGTAPGEMESFISSTAAQDTCIRIFTADHTYGTLADLTKGIEDFIAKRVANNPSLAKVNVLYLGSIDGLYAAANDVLFRLDLLNITFVLIVIFVFSVLAFRSFVAGILFVLSCVLANFAAFIYMRIRDIGLTIDTLPVISLGIGLGVDYGIYVVARIQDEVMRGQTMEDSVITGITATGAAVFSTFSVMVGGIIPWAFSPLLFHSQMSILLTFLMFTNMFAGVLVLPAFIAWSRAGFICRYEQKAGSGKPQSQLAAS
jgi:uncharacterized protein